MTDTVTPTEIEVVRVAETGLKHYVGGQLGVLEPHVFWAGLGAVSGALWSFGRCLLVYFWTETGSRPF